MKRILTEKNIVVILFVMVLITFSFAQNETKKIEHLYNGGQSSLLTRPSAIKLEAKTKIPVFSKSLQSTE
jgi:hypothetical protein